MELLTDDILPLLDDRALARLSATSRGFRELIHGDLAEPLWRAKCAALHFPVRASGRQIGWHKLYTRLTRPSIYLFGTWRDHAMARAMSCS